MILLEAGQEQALAPFFHDHVDTTVWSYLQGRFGRGWADDAVNPTCGRIIVGDFCFFGGDAGAAAARELSGDYPDDRERQWIIAVPPNESWARLIRNVNPGRCRRATRYAIKKEPDCFDRQRLRGYMGTLPEGYTLCSIDGPLYDRCLAEPFAVDFCSNFRTAEDYHERGVGFVALRGEQLVAGASSYTSYDQGIEIEIGTHPDFRRQGLATICGAALILHCLDRGLYPAWDAANPESVALSQKLGYRFDHEYEVYFVAWGQVG